MAFRTTTARLPPRPLEYQRTPSNAGIPLSCRSCRGAESESKEKKETRAFESDCSSKTHPAHSLPSSSVTCCSNHRPQTRLCRRGLSPHRTAPPLVAAERASAAALCARRRFFAFLRFFFVWHVSARCCPLPFRRSLPPLSAASDSRPRHASHGLRRCGFPGCAGLGCRLERVHGRVCGKRISAALLLLVLLAAAPAGGRQKLQRAACPLLGARVAARRARRCRGMRSARLDL